MHSENHKGTSKSLTKGKKPRFHHKYPFGGGLFENVRWSFEEKHAGRNIAFTCPYFSLKHTETIET